MIPRDRGQAAKEARMTEGAGIVVRTVLDTGAGRHGLARRLVEVPPGSRYEGSAGPGGELWVVISGSGLLEAGSGLLETGAGPGVFVREDTGVWWPAGAAYRLATEGTRPLRLDTVSLPARTGAAGAAAAAVAASAAGTVSPERAVGAAASAGAGDAVRPADGAETPGQAGAPRLSELRDCAVEVTGDRRFRVLFGPGNGCSAATQFVGEVPPGRAPVHSHIYDEVVLVLEGEGVLHAGASRQPLAPGSAVHLPPGTPHCLENTGRGTLRVLGVFHPGGSPAAKTPVPRA
jgi:mannose-6-phosphate isomerase-like protein (cupin superfamily)